MERGKDVKKATSWKIHLFLKEKLQDKLHLYKPLEPFHENRATVEAEKSEANSHTNAPTPYSRT